MQKQNHKDFFSPFFNFRPSVKVQPFLLQREFKFTDRSVRRRQIDYFSLKSTLLVSVFDTLKDVDVCLTAMCIFSITGSVQSDFLFCSFAAEFV